MRFLLHPRASSAVSSLRGKALDSLVVTSPSASQIRVTRRHRPTADISNSPEVRMERNNHKNGDSVTAVSPTTRAWGQQCSPTCGCVVRFEAAYDSESQQIQSASYHAKRIVTRPASPTDSASNQRLQAVLTNKGRPMMTECTCSSLHHLAQLTVEHMTASRTSSSTSLSLSKLKSSMEFKHLRSSKAFRQTVLSTQQLPDSDTHCFDVVEEALTALVKGYLPKARRNDIEDTKEKQQRQRRHAWSRPSFHEDDEFLQFGQLWKHDDYLLPLEPPNVVPRAMSTLRMFDDLEQQRQVQQQQSLNSRRRSGKAPVVPRDWEAYVDQLNGEEESA